MAFPFFLGIGICSKYYLYIIGTCIFKFLKNSLLNFYQINFSIKTALLGFMPVLNSHFIISSIYTYISFIIFGLIFFFVSKRFGAKEKELFKLGTSDKNSLKTFSFKGIIHNQRANKITMKKIFKTSGACTVIVLQMDLSKIIYLYDFSLFNLWTFYVVFILIFMKKYFVINIHRHQKYSMAFVIGICSISLIIATFLPYNDSSDKNSYQKVKEITGSYLYFIPILFIFIAFTCMVSYFIVYSKALMDLELFPPYLLILITGLTGLILNLIALILTSNFKCTSDFIKNNICFLFKDNGDRYYDYLIMYFKNMKSAYDNDETRSDFFVEIFILYPLYLIFSFLEFLCNILAIFYMNPNFILIRDPIFFGLQRLAALFYNIKNISAFMYLSQFFLLESAEVFGFLGYLVFLEIIELRFCNLDKNLKRNILNRTANEECDAIKEMYILNDANDNGSEDENENNYEKNESFDGYY